MVFALGETCVCCGIPMEGKDEKSNKTQMPQNLVRYKPSEEIYATLHTYMYLRDLPEITREECEAIEKAEKRASGHAT